MITLENILTTDGGLHPCHKYIGRRIAYAVLDDNKLSLSFEGGGEIVIFDTADYCCEYRYMSTDDDVQSLVGHVLMRIEEKDGPDVVDEDGDSSNVHQTMFVEVGTDVGFITLVTHNKHNGYYGGFNIDVVDFNEREHE